MLMNLLPGVTKSSCSGFIHVYLYKQCQFDWPYC